MDAPFSYEQARAVAEAFARRLVRYLFIGKSGAILLGFPDTTQDADVFVEKEPANARAIADALGDLGFALKEEDRRAILAGKDFVQIRYGPFDLDLVFAPDGIERFEDANRRALTVEGMRVAHLDDILASKRAANRVKDRESLPRLEAFRAWWIRQREGDPGPAGERPAGG
ncbi:MAG: hypothetical protein AAB215_01215 [Planctomycetota bacterium]